MAETGLFSMHEGNIDQLTPVHHSHSLHHVRNEQSVHNEAWSVLNGLQSYVQSILNRNMRCPTKDTVCSQIKKLMQSFEVSNPAISAIYSKNIQITRKEQQQIKKG